jgi:hypothetical protein
MAIDGWTEHGDTANFSLSDGRKTEGTSSLNVEAGDKKGYIVNDKSNTDSPTEVATEFQGYFQRESEDQVTILNTMYWQDEDNFIVFYHTYDANSDDGDLMLIEVSSGNITNSENNGIQSAGSSSFDSNLSDGQSAGDRFAPYRAEVFFDNNNDLRARLLEDADGDGSYDYYPTTGDIVISGPTYSGSGPGGGVALGGHGVIQQGADSIEKYYDEFRAYY